MRSKSRAAGTTGSTSTRKRSTSKSTSPARRQSATCSPILSSSIYSLPNGCWANRPRLLPKLIQPDSPTPLTRLPPMPFFSAADSALLKWRKVLEKTHDEKWDEMMSFPVPTENTKASRRKCFMHAFLHGTRHWAQLATALRIAGYKQDWQHDFIYSPAMQ